MFQPSELPRGSQATNGFGTLWRMTVFLLVWGILHIELINIRSCNCINIYQINNECVKESYKNPEEGKRRTQNKEVL